VIFCEKCGTEVNESARFCSSCGLALISSAGTPEKANEIATRKNFRKWWSLVITISLSLATAVGFFIFPKILKPDLIKFDEIKLVVGDNAYAWVGTYPLLKVELQSKQTYYENVALHLEKQDSRGEWSSVRITSPSRPGSFELNGEKSDQPGDVVYRVSIFQDERLVGSSETKKVTFLPQKSDFTYVDRIGYRFFSKGEYDNTTCPGVRRCWKVYVVSRAKVRLEIKIVSNNRSLGEAVGRNLSKKVKVEIPNINKVQVVTIPSLFSSPQSGYFDHSEELLTTKDLERIESERKKEQQNKPTPIPSTQPEDCQIHIPWRSNPNRSAECKKKVLQKEAEDEARAQLREQEYLSCIARYLNLGDVGGTRNCEEIYSNRP